MKAQAKLFIPVHVIYVFIAYASSKWSVELVHLHRLARAFADCTKKKDVDEGSGQIVYTNSCDLHHYRICEQQLIGRVCTFT